MPMLHGRNHSLSTLNSEGEISPWILTFSAVKKSYSWTIFLLDKLFSRYFLLPHFPSPVGLIPGSYINWFQSEVTQRLHTTTILGGVFPPESPCPLVAGILRISSTLLWRTGSQGQKQPKSKASQWLLPVTGGPARKPWFSKNSLAKKLRVYWRQMALRMLFMSKHSFFQRQVKSVSLEMKLSKMFSYLGRLH